MKPMEQNRFSTPDAVRNQFAQCMTSSSFEPETRRERANDSIGNLDDTSAMNEITRAELDAKLEAVEARMDARVSAIGGKIDTFLAAQVERDKATALHFGHIERDMSELKTSVGSMKTTLIVTAVSAVLAIVIGIGGFNAMLTSNMIASFQLGKSEATAQAEPQQPAPTSPEAKK